MSRRMPSGQRPGRHGMRSAAATRPRPPGQRGGARRAPRLDPPARPVARADHSSDHNRRADHNQSGVRGVRRPVGPARRVKAPRAPRRISGRAAVLGLLLLALAFAYAYPVRVYLAQEAQIDDLETSQQAQRERIRALTERVARWNDDEYVIAQARSRLQFVRRGEVLYIVGADPALPGAAATGDQAPWYRELWSNLQAADNPAGP
jgi:cell division protein FtsB